MKSFLLILTILTSNLLIGQNKTQVLDLLVQHHHLNENFEGVVMALEDGEVIYQRAFGWADREAKKPLTIYSKFPIASFTKAFTALIIMQLEEEGKLKVEDVITKYLPDLKIENLEKIQIKHLLTHSSGLGNEPDTAYIHQYTPKEMVLNFGNKHIEGIPGENFNYSNLDYHVLGLIIEKLTGKSWETNLMDYILKPIEMNDSGLLSFENKPNELTKIYTKKDGKFIEEGNFYIENFDAAGSMYSTLGDLQKFDQALYSNKLISKDRISKMYTSHPELSYVAYGSWSYNHPLVLNYPLTIERRGGIGGFNGVFMRFPNDKKTLIILSNNGQFNTDTWGDHSSLKEQLVMALFDQKVDIRD